MISFYYIRKKDNLNNLCVLHQEWIAVFINFIYQLNILIVIISIKGAPTGSYILIFIQILPRVN